MVDFGGALVYYETSSDQHPFQHQAWGSALMAHLVKCEVICKGKIEENIAEVESNEVYNTSSIYGCGKNACVCKQRAIVR